MQEFLKEVNMSDADFARWLFHRNWNGRVMKVEHEVSSFVTDKGVFLCTVIYQNRECIARIFVPE